MGNALTHFHVFCFTVCIYLLHWDDFPSLTFLETHQEVREREKKTHIFLPCRFFAG